MTEMFRLGTEGIDLGISRSAMARIGKVTGSGMSDLAVGGVRDLTGFQAAMQTGQLGSMLLVARARPQQDVPLQPREHESLVTAWDGSLQVNERLQLGATFAHIQGEAAGRPRRPREIRPPSSLWEAPTRSARSSR